MYTLCKILIILNFFHIIVDGQPPLALHQLVIIEPGIETVISLKSYDNSGKSLNYTISKFPNSGNLYQLSHVYSLYGYTPISGSIMSESNILVTGNRLVYKIQKFDNNGESMWDTFTFKVSRDSFQSYEGMITLLPSSGVIVSSSFLLDNDGWKVKGNKNYLTDVIFEKYSRGILNNYIYSIDDKLNLQSHHGKEYDTSLWYFEAPAKFLGNLGIAYMGHLQFTLAGFNGDFDKLNGYDTPLIEIECKDCVGPVNPGIKLVFPIKKTSTGLNFLGHVSKFTISLSEDAGWLKDPQNSLKSWLPPTKCDFIQVLSRLSSLRILGDWTTREETIALDDVKIINLKGQLPICSLSRPDASLCNC